MCVWQKFETSVGRSSLSQTRNIDIFLYEYFKLAFELYFPQNPHYILIGMWPKIVLIVKHPKNNSFVFCKTKTTQHDSIFCRTIGQKLFQNLYAKIYIGAGIYRTSYIGFKYAFILILFQVMEFRLKFTSFALKTKEMALAGKAIFIIFGVKAHYFKSV